MPAVNEPAVRLFNPPLDVWITNDALPPLIRSWNASIPATVAIFGEAPGKVSALTHASIDPVEPDMENELHPNEFDPEKSTAVFDSVGTRLDAPNDGEPDPVHDRDPAESDAGEPDSPSRQ